MTAKLTRRIALLGSAALPAAMGPLGFAQAATTPNATDAAWQELQDADAAFDAAYERWEAFHDWIKDQIGNEPVVFLDSDPREYHRQRRAWEKARAELPDNQPARTPGEWRAQGERLWAARDALVRAPVATMTDLERKLSVAFHIEGDADEAAFSQTILDGVRAMLGRVA